MSIFPDIAKELREVERKKLFDSGLNRNIEKLLGEIRHRTSLQRVRTWNSCKQNMSKLTHTAPYDPRELRRVIFNGQSRKTGTCKYSITKTRFDAPRSRIDQSRFQHVLTCASQRGCSQRVHCKEIKARLSEARAQTGIWTKLRI